MSAGLRRLGLLAVIAVPLFCAGPAQATSYSLTLSTNAQPTDATGVVVTANGAVVNNGDTYQVIIHYQPSGNCVSDPSSDQNQPLDPDGTTVQQSSDFPFSSSSPNQLLPGHYVMCGWLVDLNAPSTALAHDQVPLTVGAADTMSLVFTTPPLQGRTFDVYGTGVSYDAAALVDATYKPAAGATCASSFQADHGTPVDPGENSSIAGKGNYNTDLSAPLILPPGTYLFCGWMYDQGTNETIATTRRTVTVAPLHVTMQLHAPASVTGGGFPVRLGLTLDANVPVTALIQQLPNSAGGCPTAPRGGYEVLRQDVEIDHGTSGTVNLSSSNTTLRSTGTQLFCAWVLNNWSVNVNPEPVVAGPVSARVSVVHGAVFKGKTSQGFKIAMAVSAFAKQILGVQMKERLHCNGTVQLLGGGRWNGTYTETLSALVYGVVRPDAAGRFTIRQHGDGRSTVLHGRVKGKTITGTFIEKGSSSAFVVSGGQRRSCSTGTVHFTVHKP